MRETEGVKMYEDITSRLDMIEQTVGKIEELSPASVENYRNRLFEKISEVVGDRNIDEGRILTEAAIFADKANITEELVRLDSHVSQLRDFLRTEGNVSIGKKIDFLIQEMNREANTIGSKSNDKEITSMMLDLKAEIEKIREQVQNIE
jgi:uncharacterized protein (TIGR00255 family)